MFMDLLTRLMGDTAAPIDRDDAELAIAALLVRVARADDHYDQAERDRIEQVLSRRGLTAAEAGLREAERALETVCLRVGVEPEDAQRLYHQKAW